MKEISETLALGTLRLLQDLGLGPRVDQSHIPDFLKGADFLKTLLVIGVLPWAQRDSCRSRGNVIEFRGGREEGQTLVAAFVSNNR